MQPTTLMRAALTLTLLLAACSGPPPQGGGTGGGTGSDCLITGCGTNEACVNGSCLPKSCSDAVCGVDEVCSDGRCTPKGCVGQSCPSGTVCVQGGTCAPQSCNDGGFCGSDQVCTESGCIDSRCVGVLCQGSEVCANGRCYAPTCGGVSCGEDFVCDNGCVEKVCAGVICPTGSRCTSGVCSTQCGTINCDNPPADVCEGNSARHYQPFGSCDPQSSSCSYASSVQSCDSPPAASCKDAQTVLTYAPGSCDAGACAYVATESPCTSPPSRSCVNATTLRTYETLGGCAAGSCSYPPTDTTCPVACSNGACTGGGARTFTQVGPELPAAVTSVEIPPGGDGGIAVVVGKGGFAARWSGGTWTTLQTGTTQDLSSVWLSGDDGGYAVGAAKTVLSYDGAKLNPVAVAGPAADLVSVSGNSPNHVLIAGSVNNYWRYDGQNWTTGTVPAAAPTMRTAFVAANDRERIAGTCFNATSPAGCVAMAAGVTGAWSVAYANTGSSSALGPITGMGFGGCCPTAVAVGGKAGNVWFHTDSTGFSNFCGCAGGQSATYGPYSPGEITGFARGAAALLTSTQETQATAGQGGRLFEETTVGNPSTRMETYGVSSLSRNAGTAFVVTDSTPRATSVFVGQIAGGVMRPIALGEDWVRVAVTTQSTLLMNGKGDIGRQPNAGPRGFIRAPAPRPDMFAMAAGTGGTYALVAGDKGTILRLNNGAAAMTTVTSTLTKAWRSACRVSDAEMYLVGDSGQIALYDGANATAMASGTTNDLLDVFCIGTDSAVAVGRNATVLKLASGVWAPITAPASGTLDSVAVDANGVIYVAGANIFSRYSSNTWFAMPALATIDGLLLVSPTELYAVSGSTLQRFDGTSWSSAATSPWPLSHGTLSAGTVYFVGQGGVILKGP
ncbi:MAG: WD40/YVTN/BNR-like repeat-containing protein [Myxococcaceae bacterium]